MIVTTIAAQGEAKTDFNLAGFSITLDALRPSVPTAKSILKKKVDTLMLSLDEMKKKLGIEFVKNSIRASSNVQQKHEWQKNKHVLLGYEATYSYFFQIDNLDLVSKVYDTLTSLEEIKVSSPYYALKNQDKLNKKALKNAFTKVQERFESECEVLGLNVYNYEVSNWEASYSDSHRSDRVAGAKRMSAMGGGAPVAVAFAAASADDEGSAYSDSEEIELVAGQAHVTVNLEVAYQLKNQTATVPLKAKVVKDSSLVTDRV